METPDLSDPLAEELMARFESAEDLGIITNEIFPQDNLFIGDEAENEPDDIIILHMDIREPLSTLRTLLEQKLGINLKKYSFWLQEAQVLEPHKNLVDQCVKGEGLVQINVEIQTINQRINIVDVLKPTEAALASIESTTTKSIGSVPDVFEDDTRLSQGDNEENNEASIQANDEDEQMDSTDSRQFVDAAQTPQQKPCLNWFMDSRFRKEQMRLKIPEDPEEWTTAQVKHWLQWATGQFNLTQIKISEWSIDGHELCSMTHEDFHKKVPNDPGNVFWTHLELLKKCKFVAITHSGTDGKHAATMLPKEMKILRKGTTNTHVSKNYAAVGVPSTVNVASSNLNNGQIQLWQFLLDILTDKDYTEIIEWVGTEGEFILTDPESVARLWGERKNKPAMNYEKLSRALRYYYDGDMISKVAGKRFAYKFDCDLRSLLGYSAEELSNLVNGRDHIQGTTNNVSRFKLFDES